MKLPKNNKNIALYNKHKKLNKIMKILSDKPYSTSSEISEITGLTPSVVSRYVNEINSVLQKETMISAFVHRNRILNEITMKKRLCSEKLAQCRGATSGTRWIEEWTKLTEKECKILGIYSPDRKIVAHIDSDVFTKEQIDSAVRAALLVKDIIDVEPEPASD